MWPGFLKTVKLNVGKHHQAGLWQPSRTPPPPSHPKPPGAGLVAPPFRCLTLIMQSDGRAGAVLTLNPRFRCAGTSGIQLHHNRSTIVSRNAISTSMVTKTDTFLPVGLWNSGWQMVPKGRIKLKNWSLWWRRTFHRWPLTRIQRANVHTRYYCGARHVLVEEYGKLGFASQLNPEYIYSKTQHKHVVFYPDMVISIKQLLSLRLKYSISM